MMLRKLVDLQLLVDLPLKEARASILSPKETVSGSDWRHLRFVSLECDATAG